MSPELELALRAAWSRETSEDPDEWSPANPSRGQCEVTALVVRELLGGEILIATVLPRDGEPRERHAWNRLPSGEEVDLTFDQFRDGETLGPAKVGEPDPRIYGSERLERMRRGVRERL